MLMASFKRTAEFISEGVPGALDVVFVKRFEQFRNPDPVGLALFVGIAEA
jgi:hypothetical protein